MLILTSKMDATCIMSFYVKDSAFCPRECVSVFRDLRMPITVVAPSKARNVFARSNIGIVGWNPTRGMDVSQDLFCVYVVLCR
jgi:hypothetical protein